MHHCSVGGATGAFLLGYGLDSCSGAPMGMNAFSMSLIFSVITITARWLWLNNPLSVLFMVVCAVMLKMGAFVLWGELGQLTTSMQTLLSGMIIQETLAALLLTPAVFFVLYCGDEFGSRA
jgi:rod shape-determining protein MreD